MPAEKRIALFTGNYNHIADGVSRTLNRLVAYLEKKGVSVLVFGPSTDNPAIEHAGELVGVPSMAAPGRPEYRISVAMSREVRERLEVYDPTVVHVATPDLLGLKARKYALRNQLPLVATYHTHFSSYLGYYKLSALEGALWSYLRWFYKPFHNIYVPSQSMVDVLEEHGMSSRTKIWPRGVDTSLFQPSRRSLVWRRHLGFADDEVVISYISRLVWEKAPDVFAQVVEQLRKRHAKVRGLVVGDGPAMEPLSKLFEDLVFLGHLEADELATAYASSDIFLFPSDTETFGNVTLEAMASGVPAVCADATGSRSLVKYGETGFLAKPGDINSFLETTEQLVVDQELRHQMGKASLTHASTYDWEAVLGKMIEYYDAVLA